MARDERQVPAEGRNSEFATGHGMNPLGTVFNRTGGLGGTELSENAHNVAGAGRDAAQLIEQGEI